MTEEKGHKGFDWQIAWAAQTACILEVDAPKVGNVNRFHDFADASLEDFHRSALAIGRPFGYVQKLGVGRTIYEAVQATREEVNTNTNLGMVLLLAPLAMAWSCLKNWPEDGAFRSFSLSSWARAVEEVLRSLSTEDTRYVYQAIRLAAPSGMGQVEQHDVWQEDFPSVTLLEAMKLAAERDLIARQYRDSFELVLGAGQEVLQRSLEEGLALPCAIAQTHLFLLGQYPDSLIARKLGSEWSRRVQERALAVWEQGGWLTVRGQELVREFDSWLREDGHKLNPGTTADLVAAIVFVYLLEKDRRNRRC